MSRVMIVLTWLVFLGLGAIGLVLTEQVFWEESGWVGLLVGNILFPVAAAIAALYDAFSNGDWRLLMIWAAGFLFFGGMSLLNRNSD